MVLITKKNSIWWVQSVNAWPWITVDNTDPSNPIVSSILSSNLTLYSTTASSDIPWYSKIVTDIDDPDYDEPAVNVPIWPITGSDQLVWEQATSAWLIVGNPWILTITTLWEIRRTGGSGTAEFYFKVFHRDSGGTETEIAVSNNTWPIDATLFTQFSTSALLNNGAFNATDRIVVKYYATKVTWWSDPEYEFLFGWSNPVRTLIPVPAELVLTNYYTIPETDDLLDNKRDLYTREYLVTNWSVTPTLNTAITGGDVYDYTLDWITRYRFVPTTYNPTQDTFYWAFDWTNLTSLITTRW